MSERSENFIWTSGILALGLAGLGTGAWVTTVGGRYIAPGALAVLCGIFLVFMAFAGRRHEDGVGS
jgi:hypothetical protein